MRRYFLILWVVLLFSSCEEYSLRRQIRAMYHTRTMLPEPLLRQVHGAIPDSCPVMVVYHDPQVCTSCALQRMDGWDGILRYYRDSLKTPIASLFIFAPNEQQKQQVRSILQQYDKYPIILDETGAFVKANPDFPQDSRLHTFLLDSEGRVVTIGSPKYDDNIWNLYKQVIQTLQNR